jgi:hypothetical protein
MALKVLSWGCGLQSTTLAAMSALGDADPLDAVVHCDLGWERRATREIRDFYAEWLRGHGVRVDILDVGDIREEGANNHIHMPFWTETGGPLQRQCSRHFKVIPAKRHVRELLGYDATKPPHPPEGAVEMWIGFSLEEFGRIKGSRVKFIRERYPLVEMRMTRPACEEYLRTHDLPVPVKSGCVGCPYTSASEWLAIRDEEPETWAEAVAFDRRNRHNPLAERTGSTADRLYVWRGVEPLEEADLESAAARERAVQLPMFVCGEGGCLT